jgi:hypothetical protein
MVQINGRWKLFPASMRLLCDIRVQRATLDIGIANSANRKETIVMLKRHPIIALILILALLAIACNFPTRDRNNSSAPGPGATFTALAETLQVILTETAAVEQQVPTATQTGTSLPPTIPPTLTPLPLPSRTPVPPTAIPCDWAQFVSDVTVPDGTIYTTGQTFTKTWRLKNIGTCTWNTSYAVVFSSGELMSAASSVNMPHSVAPGGTVDVSVNMTAPNTAGTYKGSWLLRNASNATFGIGGGANQAFWVEIKAQAPSGPTVVYNFYDNTCNADWVSSNGVLPCPGGTGDNQGFVVKLDNPKLETGTKPGAGVIETHPTWESHPTWGGNGFIQGLFPAVNIKSGYRFKAQIGCLDGAASCDVKFYLKYSADGGAWTNLSPAGGWNETYDNSVRSIDLDLTTLAGKTVEFLFQVDANSNAGQDWAAWVYPRIEK